MKKRMTLIIIAMCFLVLSQYGCGKKKQLDVMVETEIQTQEKEIQTEFIPEPVQDVTENDTEITPSKVISEEIKDTEIMQEEQTREVIEWVDTWKYAENSKIHSDPVILYKTKSSDKKNITIAVNAGHGTQGGDRVYTLCHPDGSPKTTGGSTDIGEVKATAVAGGTTMLDGTPEAVVTLKLAEVLKNILLDSGYNVLMIRESDNIQIDNVARTIYANNCADCHVSLHFDSTDRDKGFFCIGVPDIAAYKRMEPVASHWQEHNALGTAIIDGAKSQNIKIYENGFMGMDLTQISYSTIPSVDVEVGDRKSDYSHAMLENLAIAIVNGIGIYFGI